MKGNRKQLSPDEILGNRYRILRALGQGGMAYVYLAEDMQTNRYVALKVMRDELSDDPEFIRRFATEARAAASLDHPNIVRVLDYGQDDQIRYIVQEYVEGTTLKDLIREQGSLSYQLAVPLMIQISLALEHAHQRGVIHRDIKPQNILITPDMIAKVTDFGIARTTSANTITLTGGVAFGSVHYFSPEQARGGAITERSDLYSLGIMLYEMLTGELPFDGESSVAVAIKQLQEMPPRPSSILRSIPPALDNIIFKAIQKNPERRYIDSRDFVSELDAFMINPKGRYGVVQQANGAGWGTGTSAIGVQKQNTNYNKLREIEQTISKRKKSRYRDMAIVISIVSITVIVLAVLFVWLYRNFKFGNNQPAEDGSFILKDYSGLNVQDVVSELEQKYGLVYDKDLLVEWESNDVKQGNIFAQDPKANQRFKKGESRLTLKVSAGQDESTVPDVVNLLKEEAEKKLTGAGYSVVVHFESSKKIDQGHVIRTTPLAGNKLPIGKTVFLYVSEGASKVKVPSITGYTWAEALQILADYNLSLGDATNVSKNSRGEVVEVSESQRYIIEQSPAAGVEVDRNAAISVTYGTYDDYYYFLNPTEKKAYTEKMPNFVGMTAAEANQLLASQHYHFEFISKPSYRYMSDEADRLKVWESDPQNAFVMEQSVPAGTTLDSSITTFVLGVGTREDYDRMLNPTTTPTTTEKPTEAPTEPPTEPTKPPTQPPTEPTKPPTKPQPPVTETDPPEPDPDPNETPPDGNGGENGEGDG